MMHINDLAKIRQSKYMQTSFYARDRASEYGLHVTDSPIKRPSIDCKLEDGLQKQG
jgi:hypothetical protein